MIVLQFYNLEKKSIIVFNNIIQLMMKKKLKEKKKKKKEKYTYKKSTSTRIYIRDLHTRTCIIMKNNERNANL